MSLNKFLLILLVSAVPFYYFYAPSNTLSAASISVAVPADKDDASICAELSPDPGTLSFASYSSQEGFDECVSRCMTSVMMQVCRQLPTNSNVFATQPEIREKMLSDCNQHIKNFITRGTRCPYLKCQP